MSKIIGTIREIDGKFYAVSENGAKRLLKNGDEIYDNEVVSGDSTNNSTDSAVLGLSDNDNPLIIMGNATERFTPTDMQATVVETDNSNTPKESIASLLADDIAAENIDTAAGDEGGSGPESTEGGEADFADINGATADINAGLMGKDAQNLFALSPQDDEDFRRTGEDQIDESILTIEFVDNTVSDVSYTTSSGLSGETGDSGVAGAFNYRVDDTITFKIGDIVLGEFSASVIQGDKLFLADIAGTYLGDINNEYVENMAIFLQKIDEDGNADNGITISEATKAAFVGYEMNMAAEGKQSLSEALLHVGIVYVPGNEGIVFETASVDHVQDTIVDLADRGTITFDARVEDQIDVNNTRFAYDIENSTITFTKEELLSNSNGIQVLTQNIRVTNVTITDNTNVQSFTDNADGTYTVVLNPGITKADLPDGIPLVFDAQDWNAKITNVEIELATRGKLSIEIGSELDNMQDLSAGVIDVAEDSGFTYFNITSDIAFDHDATLNFDYTQGAGFAEWGDDFILPAEYSNDGGVTWKNMEMFNVILEEGNNTLLVRTEIFDDALKENLELLEANLSGEDFYDAIAQVNIIDNDANGSNLPLIDVDFVRVTEGEDEFAIYTVSLKTQDLNTLALSYTTSQQDITVDYFTQDFGAKAGLDYEETIGTLTIPANTSSATIKVRILDDNIPEGEEIAFINLHNPQGAAFADAQGSFRINDNDNKIEFVDNDDVINSVEAQTVAFTGIVAPDATINSVTVTDGLITLAVPASDITSDAGVVTITGQDLSSLSDGNITVTMNITDAAGNTGTATDTIALDTGVGSVDNPNVGVTADISDDTNSGSNADTITNDTTPDIVGNTEAGATVVITDENGTVVGTDIADADGNYTITVDTLDEGDSTLTITSTDSAGNISSTTLDVEIDTIYADAPATVELEDESGDNVINSDEIDTSDISGSIGAGSTLDSLVIASDGGGQLVVDPDSVTINPDGTYSIDDIDLSSLSDGTVTITAKSTDTNENSTTVTNTTPIIIDREFGNDDDNNGVIDPATVTFTDGNTQDNDNLINKDEASSALISGFIGEGAIALTSLIVTDGTTEIILTPNLNADGTYSTNVDVSGLNDGEIKVIAISTDADGNTSAKESTITLDTTFGDDDNDNDASATTPTVTITEDTDNNGVINASELNGNIDVEITIPTKAVAGDTLHVTDGTTINTIVITTVMITDAKTTTSFTPPVNGTDITITATVTDSEGNVSNEGSDSATLDALLDGSDASIDLYEISDGYVNADEASDNQLLVLEGHVTNAIANSVVTFSLQNATLPVTASVDANGDFSVTIPASMMQDFVDGEYEITASVIADAAGNIATDTEAVILDTSSTTNNGGGNTDGGQEATVSLDQISDNFINKDESEEIVYIAGSTDAITGQVTIKVAGVEFGLADIENDGTFSLEIPASTFSQTNINGNLIYADGTYDVVAEVVADKAGNIAVSNTQSVTLDRVFEDDDHDYDGDDDGDTTNEGSGESLVSITSITTDTGANGSDFITSDNRLIISGTFDNEAGNSLIVHVDGVDYSVTSTDKTWTLDLQGAPLNIGTYPITATISDAAGNSQTAEQEIVIYDPIVDSTDSIVLNEISDNYINADEAEQSLEISGSIKDGITDYTQVIITFNGSNYTADLLADNKFSVTIPQADVQALSDGQTYIATATANTPSAITATEDVTVDKTVFDDTSVTIDSITDDTGKSATDFITNDNQLLLEGTYDNSTGNTLSIIINGIVFTADTSANDGTWKIDYTNETPYPDGTYEVIATITDVAGNTISATQDITIDTVADVNTDSHITLDPISENYINKEESEAIADENLVEITGTSDAIGEEVTIIVDGTIFGTATVDINGIFSLDIPANTFNDPQYIDNIYNVVATVVADAAGNTVSASQDVKLDRSATDTGNGDGTGTGGDDATITVTSISGDNLINGDESVNPITINGTTTAVNATAITVMFNGVQYNTIASNNTFSISATNYGTLGAGTLAVLASVVADAAGNLATDTKYATVDLSAGTLSNDSGTDNVIEAALGMGNNLAPTDLQTTGNLLTNDTGVSESIISNISIGGIDGHVWSENNDILVLDTPSGIIYVATATTTQAGIDYIAGDYFYQLQDAGSVDSELITYTLSDDAGNTSSASLTINIQDDAPVGQSVDKYLNADSTHTNVTNLVLTIDVSGSMAWDANGYSSNSYYFNEDTVRLDLAQAALENLISEYASKGNVNVAVIAFSSDNYSTNTSGEFLNDPSGAIDFINGLSANGGTDYDLAMDNVMSLDSANYPSSDDNFFYFISDGEPNNGSAFDASQVPAWNDYADQNFDEVYAVGVGTSSSSLTNIGGNNTIIIDDATDLDAALLSTIANVSGNLLDFDVDGTVADIGVDGGNITSLVIDGDTYNYDANNIEQIIGTDLGGIFKINFDTGKYTYSNEIKNGESEVLTVNVEDTDGDTASGTLTLNLQETINQNFLYETGVVIDGADGTDTVFVQGHEQIDFGNLHNIEALNLGTGESNSKDMTLTITDVLNITDSDDVLHLEGDAFDTVHIDTNEWNLSGTVNGYDVYTGISETATLEISTAIVVDES